jgi:hypothetical protein
MPDQTAPEPSMDEILASIRQIISEDEAPENPPMPRAEGEPLLLTERAPAPLPSLDAPDPDRGAPAAAPTQQAADGAASSFGRLSTAVDSSASDRAHQVMPPAGPSLEDVARELLRPMLKTWLDQHLASIVQARVDEEVQRFARGRVR